MTQLIVLTHGFPLLGVLCAFIAVVISLILLNLLRSQGSRLATATMFEVFGLLTLTVNVFATYSALITGWLDLSNPTVTLPIIGLLTALGFASIAYAKWLIIKG
jgi:hypothetical protein